MNGVSADLDELRALIAGLERQPVAARVGLCPPATLLHRMAEMAGGTPIQLGGQDCHAKAKGACTGDISAEMLADAGARLVIVGHSERRTDHGETDADVREKVEALLRAGLEPIVCVGESAADRAAGRCLEVVSAQMGGCLPDSLEGRVFSVAYEPIWAIGSGRTPTLEEIAEVHATIRGELVARFGETGAATPILYGGSVNPANAPEILKVAEVGGALVGGCSLKAAEFLQIVRAA